MKPILLTGGQFPFNCFFEISFLSLNVYKQNRLISKHWEEKFVQFCQALLDVESSSEYVSKP